jgi:hypothetical protein
VDEELNAVIVEESKKGEKEREEEEQAEASARQNVASIRQGFHSSGADASIWSSALKQWFRA